MMRTRNRNALLTELLICVMFFVLCAVILLMVFDKARTLAGNAHNSMKAMHAASDISEALYASDDAEVLLAGRGFVRNGDVWVLTAEEYSIEAVISYEAAATGRLRYVDVMATDGTGTVGVIGVARYFPEEAAR